MKRWEGEPPGEPQSWQSVAPWRLGRARPPDPGRFQTISQLQGQGGGERHQSYLAATELKPRSNFELPFPFVGRGRTLEKR